MTRPLPTIVLVHGAGHTARTWSGVRAALTAPSVAVDLPGRRDRPADLASFTIDEAADSVVRDVLAAAPGLERVVLVGHSAGGIVLPAIAARLGGRVAHLVFLVGLIASHGMTVAQTLWSAEDDPTQRVAGVRAEAHARMLEPETSDGVDEVDERTATMVESLNLMSQVVSWDGVSPDAIRTFVRCTRDVIQTPAMQEKLIVSCGAARVVELDAGHNAAREKPELLAAVLDDIAASTTT